MPAPIARIAIRTIHIMMLIIVLIVEVLTLDGAVFSPFAAKTDIEEAASIAAVIAVTLAAF